MHTLLVYTGNNTVPANNFDLTAATDANFGVRNGHYMFTNDFKLLYVTAQSANITDATIRSPLINAISTDGMRIAAFQKKAGVGGVPTLWDRWVSMNVMLPKFEEIQFLASTGTAQQQWGVVVLGTPDWSMNLPPGVPVVLEATTASFTPTVNVWSADQALVFNSNPRGGNYCVIGASVQFAADLLAFRINFPRTKMYGGQKLLPGWFAQDAVASFEDIITQVNRFHLGVWGYFNPVEPPMVEVFPSTSAAMTPIVRLWCLYLGGDYNQINSLVGGM